MHPQPAQQHPPPRSERVTAAELRRHFKEKVSAIRLFCHMLLTVVAVIAGLDLHAMMRAQVDTLREFVKFKDAYTTRYDSFLSQLNVLAVAMGSTNRVLADALVRMRAQVKEQTDHSERTATATVAIAREATKQAAATGEIAQQIADTEPPKPPVVQFQPAAPSKPEVVEVHPTPVQIHNIPAAPPAEKPRRRRWFHLWLW